MERNHRDSMERDPRSPPGKKQTHNGEGKKAKDTMDYGEKPQTHY